ncbi:hypothetical protein B0A50_05590 [Salinomyces thailandicus]|uniref:CSI2 protein n=1 Tax=Salinomyces thailandicus TaxID=706561 RepID=A0A4U0TVH3_9PEZI|nr:hypothetical protein B0A50_05590 [Salinomyces thailandica]
MARSSRRTRNLLLLALVLAPLTAYAQDSLTDLPDLSTATASSDATTAESTAATTDATTTADTTDATTTAATTDATTTDASSTGDSSTDDSSAAQTETTATSTSDSTATTTDSGLTDLPTIAGAGIPELYIPYTAPAPFMQKSAYPEGTVFIAVGAVLAFLGACVLLWRALVAWSIDRSVKKAALASIRGNQKSSAWGGSSSYNHIGRGGYKDTAGSSVSLDALTSAGKPLKPHFRDGDIKRESTPPPNLFFSPTAQAGPGARDGMRSSSYLPAGYYASPSAQAGGRASSMMIGGNLAPYARHSTYTPSPPPSPGIPVSQSRNSVAAGGARGSSRDGAQNLQPSRDGYGATRNSYFDSQQQRASHHSGLYAQPSSSSLAVGRGRDDLGGSRAPSAYLEDLFDHATGMRER